MSLLLSKITFLLYFALATGVLALTKSYGRYSFFVLLVLVPSLVRPFSLKPPTVLDVTEDMDEDKNTIVSGVNQSIVWSHYVSDSR